MSNGLTFEIRYIILRNSGLLGFELKIASAKFERNRFKIDGEIAENHAILGPVSVSYLSKKCQHVTETGPCGRFL